MNGGKPSAQAEHIEAYVFDKLVRHLYHCLTLQMMRSISMAKEFWMTVTSKGQVTIPAEVRRFLGLTRNQKIALVLEPETRSVRLKLPRYPSVASLEGAAGSLP